jgi:hypothetical protein
MTKSQTPSLFPLVELSLNAARLAIEAGEVIGLRLIQAAFGGVETGDEALLMITEKAQAAFDAQIVVAQSLLAGEGHLAPARAVALYRGLVQANSRRLSADPDALA